MKTVLFLLMLMTFGGGCTSHSSVVETEPTPKPKPVWPSPTDSRMLFEFNLDLPEEVSRELKVPPKLKATLIVLLHAEATSVEPMTSKYSAGLEMVISDPPGKVKLVEHKARIDGTGAGSPNSQFARLADLYSGAMNAVESQLNLRNPTTAPTTGPAVQGNLRGDPVAGFRGRLEIDGDWEPYWQWLTGDRKAQD